MRQSGVCGGGGGQRAVVDSTANVGIHDLWKGDVWAEIWMLINNQPWESLGKKNYCKQMDSNFVSPEAGTSLEFWRNSKANNVTMVGVSEAVLFETVEWFGQGLFHIGPIEQDRGLGHILGIIKIH